MMHTTHSTPLRTALEQLPPHGHLCSIYESPEEHFAVAVPFIGIGLDRGEKCIYIADNGTDAIVRDAMYAGGIDVERAIATDSLVLEQKEAAYLKDGSFDPTWMFTFWSDATAEAMRHGFPALRVTGETEWVLRGAPGLERWIEYESRVTDILAQHNCVALCQYNRQLFPPELVLDVIRTHPLVIHRGVVCRNMYYVPPDELLETDQAAREAERLLTNIREREGTIKRMVGIAEDITDQRDAEEGLARSERLLRLCWMRCLSVSPSLTVRGTSFSVIRPRRGFGADPSAPDASGTRRARGGGTRAERESLRESGRRCAPWSTVKPPSMKSSRSRRSTASGRSFRTRRSRSATRTTRSRARSSSTKIFPPAGRRNESGTTPTISCAR
jgi:MEDS: MEthanogen/methylotroph, DcmR Sensory domain